jgi:hypothetical protein
MDELRLNDADREQMDALGISEVQVRNQMELFARSSSFLTLSRSTGLDDGIFRLSEAQIAHCLQLHDRASREGRFQKFVPASGAATRMFQSLLQIFYIPQYLECDELYLRVEQGVAIACDFLRFVRDIQSFPFMDDLEDCMSKDGLKLRVMLDRGQFRPVLDYVLTGRGLNYSILPKGLIKFHRYPTECRTAFEEHLVESIHYVLDGGRVGNLHFTVAPEHDHRFQDLLEALRPQHSSRYGVQYEVSFSHQAKSTDTIAVDLQNRLFRDLQGRLHFRPGGHGALLKNLNALSGDLVYIKNIDNLVPERLMGETGRWKRTLGGLLIDVQQTVHGLLHRIEEDHSPELLNEASDYARKVLLIDLPADFQQWSAERRQRLLFTKLNRPIRVCGVVANEGEPGGAPFWVKDRDGQLSLQIVEKAQVDLSSPEQRAIWLSSSHFNPVDLVCGLRDYRGKPFELEEYVDREAVFISKKSKDGKDLKALELPGLWNGSMADWVTLFVEVPRITFNPVKTVYDLLRPEHLSEPCQ